MRGGLQTKHEEGPFGGFVVVEVYDISLSSSSDNDGDLVSFSSGSVKIIMELSASLFNKEVLSFNFVYLND